MSEDLKKEIEDNVNDNLINNLKSNFVLLLQDYANKNNRKMRVVEEKSPKDGSITCVSCILDFLKYNVRFIYKINGGFILKKGIITLNINIGKGEYNLTDVLSHINPLDKDSVVFPYVCNVETMKCCIGVLIEKLNKYAEKILELASEEKQRKKLEISVVRELKIIIKHREVTEAATNFAVYCLYSDLSLIRYTSNGYRYFINGKYSKAYKWYKKKKNLCLYEKQILSIISRKLKKEKENIKEIKKEIKKEKKNNIINKKSEKLKNKVCYNTLNAPKEIMQENIIYTIISAIILSILIFCIFYGIKWLLSSVIFKAALYAIYMSNIMLLAPTWVLTFVLNKDFRNYLFKKQLPKTLELSALYKTKYGDFKKRIYTKSFVFASIFSVALIVSNSIVFKEEYVRYSSNIWDIQGSIIEYTEIEKINKDEIILKNGNSISLVEHDVDENAIENILQDRIK